MGGGYSVLGLSQWIIQGRRDYGVQGYMRASATWCVARWCK
jgi:hypothetical protein